jgi:hypothetical protein
MCGNYTTGDSVRSNTLKHNVTPALSNLSEAQSLKARIASAPDTRGSLGIARLKDGDQRAAGAVRGKLFQIEFSRFREVGHRFFDGFALG